MAGFQGEVVRDDKGREVVRFTTASGVRAVVATSIPAQALDKLARKLERQIARLLAGPGGGSPKSGLQRWPAPSINATRRKLERRSPRGQD